MRGAGRFLPRQLLHRPHRHAANHHRAVAGMAVPTVFSIRRLPKGIQQCALRCHLEAHATLQLPPNFISIIQQLYNNSSCQVIHDRKLTNRTHSRYRRCSSRLLAIADHLPSGSRLDCEAGNIRQENRHPVDFHQTARGPGLC